MKVILCQDVKSLGKKNDLVEVAEGYGRNYLLPRGLAVPASDGKVKEAKMAQDSKQKKEERLRLKAEKIAEKIEGQTVVVTAKAGEEKLYGAITSRDIAEKLTALAGEKIDKRKVELEEPIKLLGCYSVAVRLYPKVMAKITVEVVAG